MNLLTIIIMVVVVCAEGTVHEVHGGDLYTVSTLMSSELLFKSDDIIKLDSTVVWRNCSTLPVAGKSFTITTINDTVATLDCAFTNTGLVNIQSFPINITLENLKISNIPSYIVGSKNAVVVVNASTVLVINNVEFNSTGTALYIGNGGSVSITHSIFNNCNGTAIIVNDGTMVMTDTMMTNNGGMSDDGGALYLMRSFANITNCQLSHNHANKRGGAVFMDGTNDVRFINITITSNTAVISGGGIYAACLGCSYDAIKMYLNDSRIEDNTVTSGGGGGVTLGDKTSVTFRYTQISGNRLLSDGYGSGVNILNNAVSYVHFEYCYLTFNKDVSGDGCALSIRNNASVTLAGSYVSHNHHYGVCVNGSTFTTSSNYICGNVRGQISPYSTNFIHNSGYICGVITNITFTTVELSSGVLPGDVVTITNGTGLFNDSSDFIREIIVQSVIYTGEWRELPIIFTVPYRSSSYWGPIRLISAHDQTTDTADYYTWKSRDVSHCGLIFGVPYPPVSITSRDYHVYINYIRNCSYYVPPVRYYVLGDGVNDDGDAEMNDTHIIISMPKSMVPQFVSLILESRVINNFENSTKPVVYYAPPVMSLYVTPTVAHDNITNITVCGVPNYSWMSPGCYYYGPDVTVMGTMGDGDDCFTCIFRSNDACSDSISREMTIFYYPNQLSSFNYSIIHACLPRTYSPYAEHDHVVVRDDGGHDPMTMMMYNVFMYNTEVVCKFNNITDVGYVQDYGSVMCSVPEILEHSGTLSISVSIDGGQNDVHVITLPVATGCLATVVSMTPSTGPARMSSYVVITMTQSCIYAPLVSCLLTTDMLVDGDVIMRGNDMYVTCLLPPHPSATGGLVDVTAVISHPGLEYSKASGTFNYTDSRTDGPISISPGVAVSDSTYLWICGIRQYDERTACLFNGNIISYVDDFNGTCISCMYIVDLECSLNSIVQVQVVYDLVESRIGGRWSDVSPQSSVIDICAPIFTFAEVVPSDVIISPDMINEKISITGEYIYDSEYLRCRYENGAKIFNVSGTSITTTLMSCRIPLMTSSDSGAYDLYISNDGQNYEFVDIINFDNLIVRVCPAGSESQGDGCGKCYRGYYKSYDGDEQCTKCGLFMTTVTYGSKSRAQCYCESAGMVMDGDGDGECVCKPGYWFTGETAASCDIGYYKNTTANTYCTKCPNKMTTSSAATTTITSCTCTAPFVKFNDACACPPSYEYLPIDDTCSRCTYGYYSSSYSLTRCVQCDVSKTTLTTGANSSSSCVCKPGYYSSSSLSPSCDVCPVGAICDGGDFPPKSKHGYYRSSEDEIVFIACASSGCDGGNNCTNGYTGYLCGECSIGFYKNGAKCLKCDGMADYSLYIVMIASLIALVAFFIVCFLLFLFLFFSQATNRQNQHDSLHLELAGHLYRYVSCGESMCRIERDVSNRESIMSR